jgi:succinate dehydrogenase / fumarate reductase cytochrome b subunit
MAEADRGSRPLSPHLSIYKPEISSTMSVFHRITGVGLTLAAVLVVWWFLAASIGPESFALADGVLTSWFGGLVLIASLAAFWYHFCNGIRHLWWDTGNGFALDAVTKTGFAALAGTFILFLVTLFFAHT